MVESFLSIYYFIEVSVRLTPPSYQRMEVYRILKEMSLYLNR